MKQKDSWKVSNSYHPIYKAWLKSLPRKKKKKMKKMMLRKEPLKSISYSITVDLSYKEFYDKTIELVRKSLKIPKDLL